ncbi:MAG TPA: hypothetical protein VEA61_05725 [Allosphingosinicella sp.]|nr:hypothetical protein [Allosphingosinicella sp.]
MIDVDPSSRRTKRRGDRGGPGGRAREPGISIRFAFHLSALALAAVSQVGAAHAQAPPPDLAAQFQQICGTAGKGAPSLPGDDVATADSPGFFAGDLRRAVKSRVVKIGDRYAMRAIMASGFDPRHAIIFKCAVASGSASFPEEVDRLAAMLSAKPDLGKTVQDFDYAQFRAGTTSFSVYSEPGGWVSIYKMEIMMRNIDRKYLKKGARPVPLPSVR